MTRLVYFVKPVGMAGPIKIGVTRNFINRFRCMSTDSPLDLECILKVEGGYDDETRIQTRLIASHIRGSWFEASREVLELIEDVKRVGLAGVAETANQSPRSKIHLANIKARASKAEGAAA